MNNRFLKNIKCYFIAGISMLLLRPSLQAGVISPTDLSLRLEHIRQILRSEQYQVSIDSCNALLPALRSQKLQALIAEAITIKGNAYRHLGSYSKAISLHRQALTIRKKVFDRKNSVVTGSYLNLANCYLVVGKSDKAEKLLNLATENQVLNKDTSLVIPLLTSWGLLYENRSEYSRAYRYYSTALRTARNRHGNDSPQLIPRLINIANFFTAVHQADSAIYHLDLALRLQIDSLGRDLPRTAKLFQNLANNWSRKGFYQKALDLYSQAWYILQNTQNGLDTKLKCLHNMGNCLLEWGEAEKALNHYHRALQYCDSFQLSKIDILNAIGQTYRYQGNIDQAIDIHAETILLAEDDPQKLGDTFFHQFIFYLNQNK